MFIITHYKKYILIAALVIGIGAVAFLPKQKPVKPEQQPSPSPAVVLPKLTQPGPSNKPTFQSQLTDFPNQQLPAFEADYISPEKAQEIAAIFNIEVEPFIRGNNVYFNEENQSVVIEQVDGLINVSYSTLGQDFTQPPAISYEDAIQKVKEFFTSNDLLPEDVDLEVHRKYYAYNENYTPNVVTSPVNANTTTITFLYTYKNNPLIVSPHTPGSVQVVIDSSGEFLNLSFFLAPKIKQETRAFQYKNTQEITAELASGKAILFEAVTPIPSEGSPLPDYAKVSIENIRQGYMYSSESKILIPTVYFYGSAPDVNYAGINYNVIYLVPAIKI